MNKLFFYYLLIAFGIGCMIRLVPIIINFPYPVGYDSINYYLPNLYNFENNWIVLITSFPVYLTIVYLFSSVFNVNLYYSFLTSNVILYGLFSVTIYLLSNKVLNQSLNHSLIFTVFVIFQLGTLRISWDLFRNLFSLVLFNLFLLLIYNFKKKNILSHFIPLISIFSISIITIFSDRLIGILLIIVSFISSFIYKQKYLFIINSFFTFSFLYYFLTFYKITFASININFLDILLNPAYGKNPFSQFDISILFLSMYGILIPFFITGFMLTKSRSILIIKIPLMITLFFSFTWIFIPNYSYLVPERWLLIFGIYMSLIAICGFILLVNTYLGLKQERLKKGIIISFLFIFVVYGFMFSVMPSGVIFSLPSFFQENTGFIFPLSMNFNSLKIKDNSDLLKSIDWINSNTTSNSAIIGTKHWRGWFSLFLHPPHQYFYSEEFVNINDTLLNKSQIKDFTLSLEKKFSSLCDQDKNITKKTFLYFIDLNKKYDSPVFSSIVFQTHNFVIYNLSQQICNFKS